MSLRINTNIPALTAMRHLGMTDAMMQDSVTRLSTGLRINSAGDDPAGLIISEGLRTQIKSIEQAARNTQDAVNMTRTAEAAMEEISTLLRDIRSLAVHASNTATVDAAQLEADQSQIRSTIDSINRIASQTSWGTKKLLNGSAGISTNVVRNDLVSSLYIGSEFGGEVVRTGVVNMNQTTAASQTTTGPLSQTFAGTGSTLAAGTFVINGYGFNVQNGDTLSNVVAMINVASNNTGVSASLGAGNAVVLTSTKFGSRFPINFMDASPGLLNGGNSATPAVGADAVYDVTVPIEPTGTKTETFTGGLGTLDDGLTLTSPSGNRMVVTPAGNATAAATDIGQVYVGSMRFQIGANASQGVTFSIPNVAADRLGVGIFSGESLATLDVRSQQGAQRAMQIIDTAIQQLASLRGDLGSFQKNFLESTTRSLAVSKENVTASESEIRDADIAKEMTEFTKVQILRQSGISVLAQASRAPQSVLQLLQQ
ncbi:MAG: hypothetical protein KIT11_02020 [Fimbriimonadaceae bacterium]|nr:hypothetical protein [Fimbriimonadaceae bacterium]QYK54852.1 MAG: hypothetical protein KF733_07515 [Fimbriimonadaceae bacterium]